MAARAKESDSPLIQAAVALEAELVRYEQTVAELETGEITSEKTLHRARGRLEESANVEQRLGAALQAFAQAMQLTQARQQRCMDLARAMAERVEHRLAARNVLLERMRALAERARKVNEPVAAATNGSADGGEPSPTEKLLSSLQAIEALTASIIEDADALQRAAKDDGWSDIERDTASLKQQLQAARNKILITQRNVASR